MRLTQFELIALFQQENRINNYYYLQSISNDIKINACASQYKNKFNE